MPETTCAAIRDGSRATSLPSTVAKPNPDTSVKAHEPMPTKTLVRNPAAFCRT